MRGELFDQGSLSDLCDGAAVVVHLSGIIEQKPNRGQTFERVHHLCVKKLTIAARQAGVKRWIHMSALGARPDAPAEYHRTKFKGEQHVRASGLDWTIFRPSLIHGPGGEFMQMVAGFWRKMLPPFVPYFADGVFGTQGGRDVQPVWVEDVARAFVKAIEVDQSIGEIYPMGGADAMDWPTMYRTVKQHLKGAKPKPVVGFPAWKAKLIAGWPGVPFNIDQVHMAMEDSVCSTAKLKSHLDIDVAPFERTLRDYADQL